MNRPLYKKSRINYKTTTHPPSYTTHTLLTSTIKPARRRFSAKLEMAKQKKNTKRSIERDNSGRRVSEPAGRAGLGLCAGTSHVNSIWLPAFLRRAPLYPSPESITPHNVITRFGWPRRRV
ncbi:hypothetical protein EVAR_16390_1 [Eumeta japonica]|uniref:Uncharacterized protein n=1 Tax=Eumeta variegata TaxID=151549 RepID=A0A4C1VWJ6_EUMVA|nr:hypothetical protein EVAR_16390_1 [Eumeta japonica]